MEFRIGVNLGDVIVNGENLFGDGVNIAARLEGVAEPSGICITGAIRDQIEGKLNFPLIAIGQRSLKNISRPVPSTLWIGSSSTQQLQACWAAIFYCQTNPRLQYSRSQI